MDRRALLATVGTTCFSGCVDSFSAATSDETPTRTDTSTDIDSTPTPWSTVEDCEGYEPVLPADSVHEGVVGGLSLTVDQASLAVGETLTVRLENTSSEEQKSGQKREYVVEQRGPDGWTSIFWAEEPADVGWYPGGVSHLPGQGYVWKLPVTESGLDSAHDFRVCRSIEPGQYRFVYFGVVSDQNDADAIGAQFTVTTP